MGDAVAKAEANEWEVREAGTTRVLGTHSANIGPARGDMIQVDGKLYEVRQVADIGAGDGQTQRGWLIVSS